MVNSVGSTGCSIGIVGDPSSLIIELFTSKCLVDFFSGSSRQARGQSCPTILSLAGRGWSWAGKDWKAAYLLSASASVVEGSHHTPSLDKGRRLGPDCGDLDRCTQAVISLCLECRLPLPVRGLARNGFLPSWF